MHPGFDEYVTALVFPEAARWHGGSLWYSDMHGGTVYRVPAGGEPVPVVDVPGHPGGLGWLPDGRLLVVSMHDRRLTRLDDTGLSEVADLSDVATWHCNDMVVDSVGRAYVGNFGDDTVPPAPVTPANLVRVDPDGTVTVAATGLEFPNGAVISPDGRMLVVAETRAHPARLTRFDVRTDGTLTGRRVFARFDTESPDGICLDAEGAVWIASWSTNEVVRVRDGGEIVERRSTGAAGAYSCTLGGPDGRTLFVCVAATWQPEAARQRRTGRILAGRVDVPGAR